MQIFINNLQLIKRDPMNIDSLTQFELEKQQAISDMNQDSQMKDLTSNWFLAACKHKYSYGFTWMGRPIIQFPQDMIAMQEIIWQVKPDLIIETGIAHGGSLIYYASLLEAIGGDAKIVGIDIDKARVGSKNGSRKFWR